MIEKLQRYIRHNQEQLEYVKKFYPQKPKWIGTVDYAVARLNTVLLRLIHTPLKLDEHSKDIDDCQYIIDDFVKNIRRYYNWWFIFKWYPSMRIFFIGIRRIPRIKKLLNSIDD